MSLADQQFLHRISRIKLTATGVLRYGLEFHFPTPRTRGSEIRRGAFRFHYHKQIMQIALGIYSTEIRTRAGELYIGALTLLR